MIFDGSSPLSCFSEGGTRRGKLLGAAVTTSDDDIDANGSVVVVSAFSGMGGSSTAANTIFFGSADAMACLNPFRLFLFERLAIMIVGCSTCTCEEVADASGSEVAGTGPASRYNAGILAPNGMLLTSRLLSLATSGAAERSCCCFRLRRIFLFFVATFPLPGRTWVLEALDKHFLLSVEYKKWIVRTSQPWYVV